MATAQRSASVCAQHVVSQREIARVSDAEAHYRAHVDPEDPDGTLGCAYEAARLRRIRVAITQR